jgi:nitrate/nitrite transporter NarK
MQNVAQSWLVWELTRSPVALGIIAFFDTLPRLLVGAVGGAIADRFDRRRVLQSYPGVGTLPVWRSF